MNWSVTPARIDNRSYSKERKRRANAWYTSLSGVYREIVNAFKRKYPGINIEPFRGGSAS